MDRTGGAGPGRFHSRGFATRLTPVVETLQRSVLDHLPVTAIRAPRSPVARGSRRSSLHALRRSDERCNHNQRRIEGETVKTASILLLIIRLTEIHLEVTNLADDIRRDLSGIAEYLKGFK